MKKRLFLGLLLVFALSVFTIGCGSDDSAGDNTEAVQEDTTAAETETDDTEAAEDTEASVDEEALPQTDPNEEVTIRIARQPSIYVAWWADALGYLEEAFKDYNVKIEFTEFTLGPPIIEAMASGEIDIGFMGDLPAYAGLLNGGTYTIVGKYSQDTAKQLIVRTDAGIDSLADLKGKKIAVPFGSNIQPLAELYLEAAGLTDNDVELINLSFADINTSILNGDIDAGVTGEPNVSKILNNGGDSVKTLETADGYKLYVSPIIVENEFLEKYPDITAKFLEALDKAGQWAEENPEDAIQAIVDAEGLEYDDVAALVSNTKSFRPYITEDELQALRDGADQALKFELITSELNVDDYIDLKYAEAAGLGE